MLGSRVAGLVTDKGDVYADLVIDAAGLYSPVRTQLPEALGIQNEATGTDILHTYRAFFKRDLTAGEPEYKYIVSLIPGEDCGILWAITNETQVDILIASMTHEIDDAYIELRTAQLKAANPVIGEFIRGGRVADIPVRQPLAMLVADGYAAVGDSAFMTYPVKGSGMAYAIKAGRMLADAVLDDTDGLFNAETLWEYQKTFFKEIGFSASRLAVIKAILPYMTASEINEIFKRGLVSSEELSLLSSGNMPMAKILSAVREKLKIMGDIPEFKGHMGDIIGWMGRLASIEATFPSKYSSESIQKWAVKYNRFFDSIRKPEETAIQA
jgi:flavin-dependent dehydrogenase